MLIATVTCLASSDQICDKNDDNESSQCAADRNWYNVICGTRFLGWAGISCKERNNRAFIIFIVCTDLENPNEKFKA